MTRPFVALTQCNASNPSFLCPSILVFPSVPVYKYSKWGGSVYTKKRQRQGELNKESRTSRPTNTPVEKRAFSTPAGALVGTKHPSASAWRVPGTPTGSVTNGHVNSSARFVSSSTFAGRVCVRGKWKMFVAFYLRAGVRWNLPGYIWQPVRMCFELFLFEFCLGGFCLA